ncbi:S-4TM family putative pore-forming effector [Streptomyces sp. AHA2]
MSRQNDDKPLRLLAAQRQLYDDAKRIHNFRTSLIIAGGIVGAALSITLPSARQALGVSVALTLLFVSILGSAREKRKTKQAASVQEEFDTYVFGLPWNATLADRPSTAVIAEAAERHRPRNLRDWYSDTEDLPYPLDVLVSQRSNLAWGVSDQRRWSAALAGFAILTLSLASIACALIGLSFTDSVTAIFAPLIPAIKEVFEMWRASTESVKMKEATEARIAQIWETSLRQKKPPKLTTCRELQDQMCTIRQVNAAIPSWFYWFLRDKNEKVMRVSVADYVAEARQQGLTS